MAKPKIPHGPATAWYDNIGRELYGHLCPFIVCLCGWSSSSGNRDWAGVGEEFDKHLSPFLAKKFRTVAAEPSQPEGVERSK